MSEIILVGCEFSQVVTGEFRAVGLEAYSCDLLPTEGNSDWHFQGDIFDAVKKIKPTLLIVHPPCPLLTVTGNKWFKPEYIERFPFRVEGRKKSIKFFMDIAMLDIPKICIENPVGIMSTVWRRPDQIIQPYEFGHKEPKKTCLWLKNLPPLMPTKIVEPEYHVCKSGKRLPKWFAYADKKDRWKTRSKTFEGIAKAMANQWGLNKGQLSLKFG